MGSWRPQVAIEHQTGTAAVCTTELDGELVVVAEFGPSACGTVVEGAPAAARLSGDRSAIGGALPPGAERADVRDAAGESNAATVSDGMFLAVIDGELHGERPAVEFRDARGRLVAQPRPDGAEARPAPDFVEECPACQGREWEAVSWSETFHDGDEIVYLDARCLACGHREPADAQSEGAERRAAERERDGAPPESEGPPWRLADVDFDVFELEGEWEGGECLLLGGAGISRRALRIDGATFQYWPSRHRAEAQVVVASSAAPSWPGRYERPSAVEQVRRALESVVAGEPLPGFEQGAEDPLWNVRATLRMRRRRAVAARAQLRPIELPVAGEPVEFVLAEDGSAWAAAPTKPLADDVDLTVSARGVPVSRVRLVRRVAAARGPAPRRISPTPQIPAFSLHERLQSHC